MAGGSSTHVPLSATRSLGQVHTGPLGLSKHNHSHFFLSHGFATEIHTQRVLDNEVLKQQRSLSHTHTLTLGLFIAVVEHDVSGVVDACGQVLHCASAEFVDAEHEVVDVGDAIDVVLKDIDTERVEQIYNTQPFLTTSMTFYLVFLKSAPYYWGRFSLLNGF